jgi:hypothetical protein
LLAQGCFAASAPFVAPQPTDATDLAARARSDPADVQAIASLALLQIAEGRTEEARALLSPAVDALPEDPALPLLLAIADELEGQPAAARDRYDDYRRARVGRLAARAEQRRVVVDAGALRQDAQRSLGVPSDSIPGDRGLVAVLPFARSSNDEAIYAESAAVAALMGWDLSGGWNVVDGARVRVLLDEMDVAATDLAELSLGVELGRRLGAARVVQGTMRRPSVQTAEWDITVTSLDPGTTARVDHFSLTGLVAQVLPMQQRAAVMVRESLEDEFRQDRPGVVYTVSAQALTSLGRGLLAMDRDDPSAARDAFSEAVELDGQFAGARALVARMDTILTAPALNVLAEEVARVGELQRAVAGLRTSPSSLHQTTMTRLGRSDRATVSELLGLDAAPGGTLLDLTFVLPGN